MSKPLEVSQLNKMIKDIVDNECVLEHLVVVGEVSSFSLTRGTAYFTIKDNYSILNCLMFNCKKTLNVGDNIQIEGSIKYYPEGAKISFITYKISEIGQGDLHLEFLKLKEKLEAEGLFDPEKKKPIPHYVKRVGVVTSKTGAVIQDIINVRNRRNSNLDIVLYDVQVQGSVAVEQIVEGINFFSKYKDVDCIIVARGGGSAEDLQPFNDERVARAVFACEKPIISAVGHETDYTIIDFVSDLRAPTPSAASELVTFDSIELKNTIKYYKTQMDKLIDSVILEKRFDLNDYLYNIENLITESMNFYKFKISNDLNTIETKINEQYNNTKYSVSMCLNTLDNLNPAKVLAKGYAVIKKEENYLTTFSNIQKDDIISVENNENILDCKVLDIKKLRR